MFPNGQAHVLHYAFSLEPEPDFCPSGLVLLAPSDLLLDVLEAFGSHDRHLPVHVPLVDLGPCVDLEPWRYQQGLHPYPCCHHLNPLPARQPQRCSSSAFGTPVIWSAFGLFAFCPYPSVHIFGPHLFVFPPPNRSIVVMNPHTFIYFPPTSTPSICLRPLSVLFVPSYDVHPY